MASVATENSRVEVRDGVRASLPELGLIGDLDLRERCIDAWALALSQTEFERIEDIPPTGTPTSSYLKPPLTQADHLRGTATICHRHGGRPRSDRRQDADQSRPGDCVGPPPRRGQGLGAPHAIWPPRPDPGVSKWTRAPALENRRQSQSTPTYHKPAEAP